MNSFLRQRDYMDNSAMMGYGGSSNQDLNEILEFDQGDGLGVAHSMGMNDMFDFGAAGLFTPNGMNISGGMMTSSFGDNDMFQGRSTVVSAPYTPRGLLSYDPKSSGFPFTQVDPTFIVGTGQSAMTAHFSNAPQDPSKTQTQSSSVAPAQVSGPPSKHSQEPEDIPTPKPKRTRVSKKKKLTVEQEEKKRKEFLERNRQAASKCRTRKQEANSALQAKVTAFGHHNELLRAQSALLEVELAEVKKMLLDHVNCTDPEFKLGMERHEYKYGNSSTFDSSGSPATPQSSSSFGGMPDQSMSSPGIESIEVSMEGSSGQATPSWDLQCDGSGMLSMNQMMKPEEQEQFMAHYRNGNEAAEEEYKHVMSRQNSRSSKTSSRSSGSNHEGSAYTSAITTPEASARETSSAKDSAMECTTRRGLPQKNLQNPRSESSLDSTLPGVSS